MSRLTQAERTSILCRIMDHAFGEREKRLQEQKRKFGTLFLKDTIGADTVKLLAKLPEGIVPTIPRFQARFEGGPYLTFDIPETRIPYKLHTSYSCPTLPTRAPNDPLAVEWEGISDSIQALRSERTKAEAETRSILDGCTTRKAVRERWPELVSLCGDLLKDEPTGSACTALTIPATLNSRLGLPVKKGSA